jgi:hypothetical protein
MNWGKSKEKTPVIFAKRRREAAKAIAGRIGTRS